MIGQPPVPDAPESQCRRSGQCESGKRLRVSPLRRRVIMLQNGGAKSRYHEAVLIEENRKFKAVSQGPVQAEIKPCSNPEFGPLNQVRACLGNGFAKACKRFDGRTIVDHNHMIEFTGEPMQIAQIAKIVGIGVIVDNYRANTISRHRGWFHSLTRKHEFVG